MNDINKPAADVFAAARTRRSIRAYKPDAVPPALLREIVELGRHAPSGSNIQPWRVHVLTGATLQRLGGAIKSAFLNDEPGHHRDYDYYTDPVFEPYLARRRACGWGLYGTLGIGKGYAQACYFVLVASDLNGVWLGLGRLNNRHRIWGGLRLWQWHVE